MGTVVGVTCADGVVLAGDRVVAVDGHVRSESKRHVFDLGSVGAAAVGETGAVDRFADRLDAAVRSYRTERGDPGIDPLSNRAADLADEFDVSALVTARDDGGHPRLRAVTAEGGTTDDDFAAFGSGASVALGVLESDHDGGATLEDAETLARDAITTAAERDSGTGEEVDVYRLSA